MHTGAPQSHTKIAIVLKSYPLPPFPFLTLPSPYHSPFPILPSASDTQGVNTYLRVPTHPPHHSLWVTSKAPHSSLDHGHAEVNPDPPCPFTSQTCAPAKYMVSQISPPTPRPLLPRCISWTSAQVYTPQPHVMYPVQCGHLIYPS
jgi:hypothetical protein